jgi:nucleotide-binding universal stress UspA family protein
MYNTILVPLDGSERAESILPHVQDIAQRYKSRVIFLTVLEVPQSVVAPDGIYVPSEEVIERHRAEAEEYLKKHQAAFEKLGVKAEVRIAQSRIVDAICQISQDENVDLVAIASHGRTGLAQVFFGSVAVSVLHRITRPLLLVRAE